MTTSGSCFDAREVVVVRVVKARNDHLRLVFRREGGGVVVRAAKARIDHLRLAFRCKGGEVVVRAAKEA